MLTHLGDAVLFLPLLDALGESCGTRSIDIVVKPPVDQLIRSHASLRRIHVFHCPWVGAGRWRSGIVQWLGLVRTFRREKYNLVVVTHAHELSSLTAYLCGADGTAGWVFDGDRFLDRPLVVPLRKQHAAKFAVQLIDQLGLPPVQRRTGLPVADEACRTGKDLVRRLRKGPIGTGAGILVVHPGAGGERKIWPPENFAAVINAFLARHHTVVLLGGEKERLLCAEICNLVGSDRVADLCGKLGVGELAGVISEGDAYLGNDSGPSHMAAALGVPTHVIFGQASDPGVWAPIGPRVCVTHFAEGEFRSSGSVAKVLMALGAAEDNSVNSCAE
jgi:ADP-heptose:LPS heptosyltransferase